MRVTIFLVLLLSLAAAVSGFKHISVEQKVKFTSELVDAVRSIAKRALLRSYKMIHLVTAVTNETGYFRDLKSQLLAVIHEHYMCRLDNNTQLRVAQYRLRQNSIFLIDSIEGFRATIEGISVERYRFSGNFLFVLVNGYFDEVVEIYERMWKRSIFNVYCIYIDGDRGIALNTFMPYASSSACGNTSPKVVARFRGGKFDNEAFLLTPKLQNLQKCPVRIATYEDPGCLMVRNLSDGSRELYGYRMEFMEILASTINYTNAITMVGGEMPWGIVYGNGSATGAFREILENRSDVAFSEYYLKSSRNQLFDSSTTFYSTPLVFVIPPGRKFTSLEKLLQPFEWPVWLALLLTFGIALLVIGVINFGCGERKAFVYGTNVRHPITNMIVVLLGMQQTKLPRRNFSRFLLTMFLILCLVLRSLYQGSLYQFLQSEGRHKEVQSIQEMIDRDFTFYMFESALDLVQHQAEILSRTQTFKGRDFIVHSRLDGTERIAGLISLSDVATANTNRSRGFVSKVCRQPFMTINIVIYYRKSFYLIDEINKKITRLISSGIIDYWLRTSMDALRRVTNSHPRKLNMDDLKGPFNVLIIGHVGASLVFALEMLVRRVCAPK